MPKISAKFLTRLLVAGASTLALAGIVQPVPAQAASAGQCTLAVRAEWPGGDIGGNSTHIQCNNAKNVTLYMRVTKYWSIFSESKTKTYSWSTMNSYLLKELPISLIPPASKLYASSQACFDYSGARKCVNKDDWLYY